MLHPRGMHDRPSAAMAELTTRSNRSNENARSRSESGEGNAGPPLDHRQIRCTNDACVRRRSTVGDTDPRMWTSVYARRAENRSHNTSTPSRRRACRSASRAPRRSATRTLRPDLAVDRAHPPPRLLPRAVPRARVPCAPCPAAAARRSAHGRCRRQSPGDRRGSTIRPRHQPLPAATTRSRSRPACRSPSLRAASRTQSDGNTVPARRYMTASVSSGR